MAQLSAAIDGIAEACTALGTPITGGNVSLYNETRGEGIYPTPVLGIVGILDDVTKAVPAHFQQRGDAILLLWPIPRGEARSRPQRPLNPGDPTSRIQSLPASWAMSQSSSPKSAHSDELVSEPELAAFGSSEYAKVVLGGLWGSRRPSISKPKPTSHPPRGPRRSPAHSLGPRHLRRRHRCRSRSGRIRPRHRRHRRAGTVADGPSALRPLRRACLYGPRHRRRRARSPTSKSSPTSTASSPRASAPPAAIGSRSPSTAKPSSLPPLTSFANSWAAALEAALHDEVLA